MRNKPAEGLGMQALSARMVVFACAASAGAHAGLVPWHLRNEPRMGFSFLVAVALLLATGIAAALHPRDRRVATAAALLFASLIAAYIASRTTGIPLLQSDSEPLDALGVIINLTEALGFAFAFLLTRSGRHRSRRRLTLQEVSR